MSTNPLLYSLKDFREQSKVHKAAAAAVQELQSNLYSLPFPVHYSSARAVKDKKAKLNRKILSTTRGLVAPSKNNVRTFATWLDSLHCTYCSLYTPCVLPGYSDKKSELNCKMLTETTVQCHQAKRNIEQKELSCCQTAYTVHVCGFLSIHLVCYHQTTEVSSLPCFDQHKAFCMVVQDTAHVCLNMATFSFNGDGTTLL